MTECSTSKDLRAKGELEAGQPLLSVCIATRNRASYLGQTLDNILDQCGQVVEVVVVDGASTDDTAAVVEAHAAIRSNLKYYPQTNNSGIDGDFDKALEFARGRYCWLMSDDDLLAPGAMTQVLSACRQAPDAVIVDAEVRTADFTETLVPHRLAFKGERHYGAAESEQLFIDCGRHLNFIGGLVVRRELWLNRERKAYYGSEFIHVGVLFQAPLPGGAIAIGEPLVRIRYGVGNWTSRSFQVWMFKWPSLIWSFECLPESSRAAITPRQPWRDPALLALYRAKGWYSWYDFNQFIRPIAKPWQAWLPGLIAIVPGWFLNITALIYARFRHSSLRGGLYDLRRSRHYLGRRNGA